MPSQSAEHFRTTVVKVGSNGEIVHEIKRKQQLNLHRTGYGAARCNPEVTGSSHQRKVTLELLNDSDKFN